MTNRISISMLLPVLLAAAFPQAALCDPDGLHAVFAKTNGDVIEVDSRSGTLRTPRLHDTVLRDCSDEFQACFTDGHGFAFAYFRKCNDAETANYERLRFSPKIVSALHNDLWIVFDASPNYMFHYVIPKGVVGIYVGATPSYDFRSVLRQRNFRLSSLDATEYRITDSDAFASCSE
ncbi:hypothetical protein EC912_10652 [Luteibacter rhizovicinus]|uniref:Uncharacterized protein n=1 Tax=Luteibacter rhizovicinus TaxID=242606 RepID=A0A4R3YNI4_9GAMM|nr:hypothetical protein [Luteibacter rhizovicinus]TCV92714.1 hypothetical protein EC912_10652 [Luteibacter rhizovicinus]